MIARLRKTAALLVLTALTGGIAAAQSSPLPGNVILPPQNGVYLGAYVQGDSFADATHSFEGSIAHKLAMHVSFMGFDKLPGLGNDPTIQDDLANNRIPLISWGCRGTQLTDIASGADDARLDRVASGFKALGSHPVMVRFMWEMNLNVGNPPNDPNGNNCFSGGDVQQDASEYVAAQRHIEDRLASDGVRNVTWLWCPGGSPGNLRHLGVQNLELFYPGARYVDWICYDGYDRGGHGAAGTLAPFARAFAHLNKPMIVAETGESAEPMGRRAHESQAQYLADLANAVKPGGAMYPEVKAICYFHSIPRNSGVHWRLEGEGLNAFGQVAQDPYFNPPIVTGPRR